MVDFSFDNESHSSSGEVLATGAGELQSLWYCSDSGDGPPLEWSGLDPAGTLDARFPVIHLGVMEPPLFAEDFESGDLTLWSSTS